MRAPGFFVNPVTWISWLSIGALTACGSAPGVADTTKHKPDPEPTTPPAPLSPITTAGLAEISGSAADDIWAVGANGTTVHYDGKQWSLVPSGSTTNLLGVWTGGPKDAWAVGETEAVLHWDGRAWSPVVASATGVLIGVWGSGKSDVWAVGIDEGSAFFRRWDGESWQYNWLDIAPSFWDVWGSGPADVWTVGSAGPDVGQISRFDGMQFNHMAYDGPPLRSITGTSADDVWLVAQANPMQHWNGTSFEVPPGPPIQQTLFDVWAASPSDAWACGTGGQMIHWDGSSWEDVDLGTTQTFQGIWGTAEDNVWAVGASGIIFHFDGTAWTSVFTPPPATP